MGSLDKAKPFERRGRKAAGPTNERTAELPKVEPLVSSAFLFWGNQIGPEEVVKKSILLKSCIGTKRINKCETLTMLNHKMGGKNNDKPTL